MINLSAGEAKALEVVAIISEAIQELGEVPEGHLYARVMGVLDLQSFNHVLTILKQAKRITVSNHLITWIGGK